MKHINDQFLQNYNSNNLSDLFAEIVKLLKGLMHKKDIYYTRVYRDNTISIITTNAEWLSKWLSIFNDFNGTLFQEKINKAISSVPDIYAVWNYVRKDKLLEFNHHHQIDQGFDIYRRKKDYVEIWAFSGKSESSFFHDFCIDNIHKLEKITSECANILESYKDLFFTKKAYINLSVSESFNTALLTPREIECVRLLVKCMTVKEVARILNIAPKTVEGYINNIKQKTRCHYKNDLIKAYRNIF